MFSLSRKKNSVGKGSIRKLGIVYRAVLAVLSIIVQIFSYLNLTWSWFADKPQINQSKLKKLIYNVAWET